MKSIAAILAIFTLLAFSACSRTPVAAAGQYVVAEVNGQQVETPKPIIVTYSGERLSGNGPVNNWNFPISKNNTLGMGISTKMAGKDEHMQLEDELLKALNGGTLVPESDGVILVKKGDTTTVVLTPVNPSMSPDDPSPTAIPANEQ